MVMDIAIKEWIKSKLLKRKQFKFVWLTLLVKSIKPFGFTSDSSSKELQHIFNIANIHILKVHIFIHYAKMVLCYDM